MRRMTQNRGLVAAMEAEAAAAAAAETATPETTPAPEVTPEAPPAEPIEQNADSLETDLMDVSESAADGEADQADLDAGLDADATLTDVSAALESCAANGGLNKDAAHVLGLCLEGLYKQAGIDRSQMAMPALESFGGTGSRVSATKLAMEEINEKLKQIWEAIKLAIKKSIAWFNEHFIKIFGAAGKLKGRAEKIKAQAGKATGDAKSKTVEDERLVGSLHIGGKIDGVAGAVEVEKIVKDVLKQDPAAAGLLLQALKTGTVEKAFEVLKAFEPASFTGVLQAVSNPKQEGLEEPKEGFAAFRSGALPGGKAVLAYLPDATKVTGDKDFVAKFGETKLFVGDGFPNVKAPTDKTLPTLSTADIAKIADLAAAIGVEVEKFKLGVNKVTETKNAILSEIDKLSKSEGEDGKILGRLGTTITKLVDAPIAGFAVYAVNTAKRLLDYCELSLKQYGAGAAAPAAPAAAEKKPAEVAAA